MCNLVAFNRIIKNKIVTCSSIVIPCLIILCIGNSNAEGFIQNDVIKGMKIENVRFTNDSIHLQTTGAIFKIEKKTGKIEIYQRIGEQRKLAVLNVSETNISLFKNKPHYNGFDYEWGDRNKGGSIVISGDSLLRFYNVKKIKIKIFFQPIHFKINDFNKGLIALDKKGGVAIMPPDNFSSGKTSIKIDKNVWMLDSDIEMSTLFFGVCPPREFNSERSTWGIVHYSSHVERYPSDEQIKEYSKFAKVLEMHQWVWKNRYINKNDCSQKTYNNCDGNNTPLWFDSASWPVNNQWIADDEKELKRVVNTAHSYGMLAVVYFNGLKMEGHAILPEAARLKKKYNIDGIYLDGLLNKSTQGPLDAYLTARELRKLFGDDGWINFHNTHKGYFAPFIQAYMDFITTGEHNKFDRWTSTTFNISNAIGGYWPEILSFASGKSKSKNIKDAIPYLRELVDSSLKYNNRILFLVGKQGQWRLWRLYFTPDEMKFMKEYYLDRISGN